MKLYYDLLVSRVDETRLQSRRQVELKDVRPSYSDSMWKELANLPAQPSNGFLYIEEPEPVSDEGDSDQGNESDTEDEAPPTTPVSARSPRMRRMTEAPRLDLSKTRPRRHTMAAQAEVVHRRIEDPVPILVKSLEAFDGRQKKLKEDLALVQSTQSDLNKQIQITIEDAGQFQHTVDSVYMPVCLYVRS